MSTIFAYVKIFDKQKYAEDFLNGKLFMNTIRYFKEYTDENGELRGDDHEGIVALYQPDKLGEINLGEFSIPASDLAAPIAVHSNEVLNKNAFCIYSLNSRGHSSVSAETLKDFRNTLEVPQACYSLGTYCVGVLNATEFQNRIKAAIHLHNLGGSMGLVDYFNEHDLHGSLPTDKHGFQKRSMFSHQREYRLVVDLMNSEPKPFTLEIGDISDICTPVVTPEEFNKQLKIQLPDGSRA